MPRRQRRALLIAGNGFIGSRVAIRLAEEGHSVFVHHGGAQALPGHANIQGVAVPRTPPPITTYPTETLTFDPDVAIHFYCMGASDGEAFRRSFDGKAGRLVLISSCDVYRAYGRFIKTDIGAPDPTPIDERAPPRDARFPYRRKAQSHDALEYWYDKIDAERALGAVQFSETVMLRLPKVYGRGGERLETVYGFAHHPNWRWTHGHVENVAAAIALAAMCPDAAGEILNIGEASTPTMGERLAALPRRDDAAISADEYDFRQDLDFSTEKIRRKLGFRDVVDEFSAMRRLAEAIA